MNLISEDLDEQRLEQLEAERPAIKPASVRAFHTALLTFVNSTSYTILKHMPVSSVVSIFESSDLLPRTFLDLVEAGAIEFCSDEKVDEELLNALTIALGQLSTEQTFEIDQSQERVSPITPVGIPHTIVERPDIPVYGSIESEKRISEALLRLGSAARFDRVRDLRVERFWSRNIVSAPFIESMRFSELVGVRVEDLLKKRSFGNAKVHGLLCCIDDCLVEIEEMNEPFAMAAPDGSQRVPVLLNSPEQIEGGSPEIKQMEMQRSLEGDALYDALVCCGVKAMIDAAPDGVLKGFLNALVTESGVRWVLDRAFGDSGDVRESMISIERAYRTVSPDSLSAFKTILRTSGTDESTLANIAFNSNPSSELCRLGIRLLLPACGAREVEIWGQQFTGYWSSSEAARVALDGLLQRLPMSDAELKSELEGLLPTLPLKRIIEVFAEKAVFDKQKNEWSKQVE